MGEEEVEVVEEIRGQSGVWGEREQEKERIGVKKERKREREGVYRVSEREEGRGEKKREWRGVKLVGTGKDDKQESQ